MDFGRSERKPTTSGGILSGGEQVQPYQRVDPGLYHSRESTGNLSLKEALPQAGSQSVSTFESGSNFFTNPTINSLIRFENCLSNRDEIDQKIIMAILRGKSYEQMEECSL